MAPAIVAFDGPVGVGKSTLGRAVSQRLGIGFVDGDACSEPGPWIRSILRTNRRIVARCERHLHCHPAVIVAYPLRCKDWLFLRETFRRRGIGFFCIGLTADLAHIANRDRVLAPCEIARTAQMIEQGYGRRPFSDRIVRTDDRGFESTCDHLAGEVGMLLGR